MRAGPRLAIAIGTLACQQGIPVRFFTASGLIMRLRKAKTDNRLDQELKTIGKADLLIIDELGYLPIDIDGARLLSPDHRRQLRKEKHHPPPRTSSSADGATCSATATWPPPSSTASTRHGRIIRFHGESYRNTHSLMK